VPLTEGEKVRMRSGALSLVLSVLTVVPAVSARDREDEVKEYLSSLEGKVFWLKANVARIQAALSGRDVTNVYPDGTVSYRNHLSGLRSTITTDVNEFVAAARQASIQQGVERNVRVFNRGTRVTVKNTSADDQEAKIDMVEAGGTKLGVMLKFERDDYTAEDVKRSVGHILAESQADLSNVQTVSLELGMSVDKVISLKGKPKTQVTIGRKTVLTYDDVKLVFEDDKLADVQ
jgi:hypothetical protein